MKLFKKNIDILNDVKFNSDKDNYNHLISMINGVKQHIKDLQKDDYITKMSDEEQLSKLEEKLKNNPYYLKEQKQDFEYKLSMIHSSEERLKNLPDGLTKISLNAHIKSLKNELKDNIYYVEYKNKEKKNEK